MNNLQIIEAAKQVIKDSGCSPFAVAICQKLFLESNELTTGCYITLSIPNADVFKIRTAEHSWRDIEDIAGGFCRLNELLVEYGSKLEFFAAGGLMDKGAFIRRVSSDTSWFTYWLCQRSDQQVQSNLTEIKTDYMMLAAEAI
jgi:hypothetical protein